MNNTVLVTGANGQLGSELRALGESSEWHESFEFHFVTRSMLDLLDESTVTTFCKNNNIDTIVNCAAYTAVDKAESEEILADDANHQAVKVLAKVSKLLEMSLIHISTDYVFDGNSSTPYKENDAANPQGVYGKSKLAGEQAMQFVNPAKSIIIRTSWVYSSFGNNFVKTMLKLGSERDQLNVVFDQLGSPTYAKDLALAILQVIPRIDNADVEIYHFANEGVASWYDFAKVIFDHSSVNCHVSAIESIEYPTPAIRPHYSYLNKTKIKKEFGLDIPYWQDSLIACLNKLDLI